MVRDELKAQALAAPEEVLVANGRSAAEPPKRPSRLRAEHGSVCLNMARPPSASIEILTIDLRGLAAAVERDTLAVKGTAV
jgi:hypothetical protein